MLGQQIADPCLETMNYPGFFSQGHISLQDDIHQADLTDCYIDFLNQFQIQANLVIPIAEGAQLWGLMAIQQCSAPRHWLPWEIEFLSRLATKLSIAIQQSQLYQQTQQLVLREQSLNRVIQAVRHSLDLSTIFQTTTSEIGQLLQVDQVSIIQYQPEQEIWLYLERYCRTPEISPSYVGLEIPDGGNPHAEQLKRFEIVRIDEPGQLEDEFSQILAATFPGSWLFIPLRVHDTLWGAIGLVHHHPPFAWQDWQVELTSTIADQLAIAIQQSELYTEVQRLNASLEAQVLERTALLHLALSFEALLKRITDKVRDSLDENQILQAAVDELGQGLGVFCCGAALYSEDLTTARITHEYVLSLPRAQNLSFKIADEIAYAVYLQLFQAQYTQFCLIVPNPLRPTEENHAILACPIFDDQGVLGDLWLFKSHQDAFGEIEIRLVEQVANQCAIALRQSRLYQAAQAQVTELERLSRLKDDFLSTISHELRTPMSSIKMAIQMLEIILLQNGQSDPPPAKTPEIRSLTSQSSDRVSRYFRILQEECQREIDLIDDMLDLSRLEAETEPLLLSRIEPQIWIDHAVEPFIERIRSQQQRLELDLPAGLPVLVTDLSCLGRILSELLVNACKYTPAGETITVFACATDTGLHIGVANSGIEISAEELPRIFDKFYRVPNHDRWRHGGTGLGLALVKKLVNHLGASIQVESAGGKTTFLLTFPRRDEL
jgi:GAF domain-containing protein